MNKYAREITQTLADEDQGFTISVDVYDVLRAFNVTDPAIQHAIKKLLCTGIRGHKDTRQDLEEAIQSIERALDVVKVEEKLAEAMAESQSDTSDNPQESPACPWRFGDVIRTRGKGTDFDWTITEITPRGVVCRTGSRGEISTFIPFASCKDYGLVKEVEADDKPACPFKVGDVVQARDAEAKEMKWKITHIKDGKLLVTSHDPYQTPSWIEQVFWNNYRVIEQAETAAQKPQPCPFKVGDVIQSVRWSDYVFRVYEIRGDIMEADSVTSGSRFEIPRDHWGGYRLKSETGVDKAAATC